jgi:hypothetical protein
MKRAGLLSIIQGFLYIAAVLFLSRTPFFDALQAGPAGSKALYAESLTAAPLPL